MSEIRDKVLYSKVFYYVSCLVMSVKSFFFWTWLKIVMLCLLPLFKMNSEDGQVYFVFLTEIFLYYCVAYRMQSKHKQTSSKL